MSNKLGSHTNLKVAVASVSFSKNQILRKSLMSITTNVVFNETNQLLQGKLLLDLIGDADIVIAGTEQYSAEILSKCPNLNVISKYGVGLDNIDFDACDQFNIQVRSKQGVNKLSVAEMTLGFMLSLTRNLYKSSITLKAGSWVKNGGFQLSGKTIGIIGVGHIGKELVRLLEPFNCRILVNDIIDQSNYYQENNLESVSKEQLLQDSDVVTIHTDLTAQSKYMMNKTYFKLMKETAYFINTARGDLVVQSDLKAALLNETIAGAAVDVYDVEPINDMQLIQLPNFYCTPHIGGNASEAVLAMGNAAINEIKTYFE